MPLHTNLNSVPGGGNRKLHLFRKLPWTSELRCHSVNLIGRCQDGYMVRWWTSAQVVKLSQQTGRRLSLHISCTGISMGTEQVQVIDDHQTGTPGEIGLNFQGGGRLKAVSQGKTKRRLQARHKGTLNFEPPNFQRILQEQCLISLCFQITFLRGRGGGRRTLTVVLPPGRPSSAQSLSPLPAAGQLRGGWSGRRTRPPKHGPLRTCRHLEARGE